MLRRLSRPSSSIGWSMRPAIRSMTAADTSTPPTGACACRRDTTLMPSPKRSAPSTVAAPMWMAERSSRRTSPPAARSRAIASCSRRPPCEKRSQPVYLPSCSLRPDSRAAWSRAVLPAGRAEPVRRKTRHSCRRPRWTVSFDTVAARDAWLFIAFAFEAKGQCPLRSINHG